MILVVGSALALLSPLLRRRSLRPLARVELRWPALVTAALLLQVVALATPVPAVVAAGLHVGSYACAGLFLLANARVPGVALVGLGAALNGVTIALNGGTLPARREAMVAAGFDPAADGFTNSGLVADPVLPWLGDVFAWPAPLPLANTFSVGDVVILLGVGYGAHRLCGRREAPPRTAAARREGAGRRDGATMEP